MPAQPKIVATTEFKIEKGIPLPPHGNSRRSKYPFDKLEVGDSFAVMDGTSRNTLSTLANRRGLQMRAKFTVRPEGSGYRVWRTA